MIVSRGFIAALAGIAMTLFAWYGPWAWPAWPAFTTIDLVFGSNTAFADLPFATRAATITMLIIVNSMFWAAVVWMAMRFMRTPSNESTGDGSPQRHRDTEGAEKTNRF